MELSLLFDLISTLAVVVGIIFGLIQLRQYRLSRKRESALYLLNSHLTSEFIRGTWMVLGIPDGLSKKEIEEKYVEDLHYIVLVMSTWEAIGILLFNKEVTINMIDDAYGGLILLSWRRLERFVNDMRQELGRETISEWFQWLSDRMKDHEIKKPPVPAHIAYRNWE